MPQPHLYGQFFPGASCPNGYCKGYISTGSATITVDDRRHQLFTELGLIDGIRQKLVTGNSSNNGEVTNTPSSNYGEGVVAAQSNALDGAIGSILGRVTPNSVTSGVLPTNSSHPEAATQPAINALVASLGSLSSDPRIKVTVEDAIQALKTGDTNKTLLDLNEAHNGINQQLANSTLLAPNSASHHEVVVLIAQTNIE